MDFLVRSGGLLSELVAREVQKLEAVPLEPFVHRLEAFVLWREAAARRRIDDEKDLPPVLLERHIGSLAVLDAEPVDSRVHRRDPARRQCCVGECLQRGDAGLDRRAAERLRRKHLGRITDGFRELLADALHSAAAVCLEEANLLALERVLALRHPCAHGRRHRTPPVRRADEDEIVLCEVKPLDGLDRAQRLSLTLRFRLVAALLEVAGVRRLGFDLEEVGASFFCNRFGGEARVSAP